jgi:hypothetical protein
MLEQVKDRKIHGALQVLAVRQVMLESSVAPSNSSRSRSLPEGLSGARHERNTTRDITGLWRIICNDFEAYTVYA